MRAMLLLLLVSACEREWVREYEGSVPGTCEELTTVLLVRDALTGRPIQGATVRQRPENEMGRDGRWAPLAASGKTDEYGLVTFRFPEMPPIAHWTVHADGYAPTETYLQLGDDEVELSPGRRIAGRLLGFDGRPLAGAVVEWKVGCAHSPALASATSDATGLYRFECIDDGDFVPEDPRGAADYLRGPRGPSFGIPVDQVLPGRTVRGRVVLPDGSPPAWAVVTASARGPRAVADAQGRFVLRGLGREALQVWWPGPMLQSGYDYAPGLEARLVVGGPRMEHRRVEARVRVEGDPPCPLRIHFDSLADGRRLSFDWAPDDPCVRVPLGVYRVSAGHPWSSHVAPAVRADLRASRQVALAAHAQPTLDLGDLPGAIVVLRDESWKVEAGEPAYLPAGARAWLRADLGRTPYTFPIGPVRDGVRRADVRLPGRKFIRVPGLEDGLSAELVGEIDEIAGGPEPGEVETGSAGLATYAVGEQWLELRHPERGHAVVKLDLPFEAATVEPDCTLAPWPEPVKLRVVLDDGTPVADADVEILDGEAQYDMPGTDANGVLHLRGLRGGLHLRISREGCVLSWAKLLGGPPYEVRLGTAVVEVDVTALEEAACVLDGVAYDAEEGRLVLRGLAAGPHTLIVGARGRKGVAFGLVLREGETRSLRLP